MLLVPKTSSPLTHNIRGLSHRLPVARRCSPWEGGLQSHKTPGPPWGLSAAGPACLFRSVSYHFLLPVEFAFQVSQLANQPAGYSFPKEGAGERAHLDSFLIMAQQHSLPHAYPMSLECEFANPSKIYDQNFGEGLSPGDILAPTLYHGYYIRPRINKQLERGISEVTLNEHKFQVFLDVCQFTPDEIAVRTVDNLLEVTAQHPQKVDRHGFISREFTRTYILPLDVDPLSVKATVTHDGILSIEVRRTGKEVKAKVNEVEVTSQGQSERKAGSSGETTDP